MQKVERFNTLSGTFVQIEWDEDPMTLQVFLKEIGDDLIGDGWGWEPRLKTVILPNQGRYARKGDFIICAIDRSKKERDRYMVNSISLSELLRKL